MFLTELRKIILIKCQHYENVQKEDNWELLVEHQENIFINANFVWVKGFYHTEYIYTYIPMFLCIKNIEEKEKYRLLFWSLTFGLQRPEDKYTSKGSFHSSSIAHKGLKGTLN